LNPDPIQIRIRNPGIERIKASMKRFICPADLFILELQDKIMEKAEHFSGF
jgi:hypothetical protein